jgi:ATP-binding cassette, subfamily G (WHITE), member 2, PDR
MESYRQESVGNKERALAYLQSAQAERSSLQLKGSPYTVSMFTQAQGLMKRRAQILKGGWAQEAVQITLVFKFPS